MVSNTNILIKTSIVQTWKSFNRGLTNRPPPNPVVSDVRSLMRSGTCPQYLFQAFQVNSVQLLSSTPPNTPTLPLHNPLFLLPNSPPTVSPHIPPSPIVPSRFPKPETRHSLFAWEAERYVNCQLSTVKAGYFPFSIFFKHSLTFCLLSLQSSHLWTKVWIYECW